MRRFVPALLLAAAVAAPTPAPAATVTDLAGRSIDVPDRVERVILAEGRQFYIVAALDRDAPLARVVGWRDDLLTTDRQTFEQYRAAFPAIADVAVLGDPHKGSFSAESAIALHPDLVVFNLSSLKAVREARLIDQLEGAGIPSVFVDFREDPLANTVPSIRLLGTVLDRRERAEEIVAFYQAQIARVTERLAGIEPGRRPSVFVERAAGLSDECCNTFGPSNMGDFVTLAGGRNVAEALVPGTFGTVNREQVIAFDPEVYVATGANWSLYNPANTAVSLGPGSDEAAARGQLSGLVARPGFSALKATKDGRVHAIWHQFYISPYHFAAIQAFATWFHPEAFADLDPDAVFREFHERFLPIPYSGGYWVSLAAPGK